MTDDQALDLRDYVRDVAAVQAADGHRLRLYIAFVWLGASDYTRGSPSTGLGYNRDLSAAEFVSRVEMTPSSFDPEVMIGAKADEDRFLATNYPRFVSVASARGTRSGSRGAAVGGSAQREGEGR